MSSIFGAMFYEFVVLPLLSYASFFYFTSVHTLFVVWNSLKGRGFVPKPNEDDLNQLLLISACQAAEMIRTREIRSQQLVEVYIRRLEHIDNLLNAVVQENFDEAVETAKNVDDYLESLDPDSDEFKQLEYQKPLLGVPFSCKDSVRVKGLRTVCGIPAFANSPPNEEDAAVIQRLREAGAIHLFVSNVPEAGLWWESNNQVYGRTRNPYDLRLTCGGSSGGEASLISGSGSLVGIGSDFGGSIRIPAAFCGVFGFKPTAKLIPFKGHVPEKLPPFHREMVTLGPICRYAIDLPLVFKVMLGPENAKLLKLDEEVNLKNVKVFYMRGLNSLLCSPVQKDCLGALHKVVKYFEKKYDNTVYNVDFSIAHHAIDIFLASMQCEGALPVRNCLAGFKEDEGVNTWWELVKFVFGQSGHSGPALQAAVVDELPNPFKGDQNFVASKRNQLKREISELLGDDGILIFPGLPRSSYYHNEPVFCPFDFVYTGLFNALGLPVVMCPVGLNSSNCPLSVQIVGGVHSDRLLLAAACDLEEGFGGWTPNELH